MAIVSVFGITLKCFFEIGGARREIPFSIKNNILYYMGIYNVLLILIFNNGDCKAIISVWFTTGYVIE